LPSVRVHSGPLTALAFERSHTVYTLVLTPKSPRCSHVLTPLPGAVWTRFAWTVWTCLDMSGYPDMAGYVWICLDLSGFVPPRSHLPQAPRRPHSSTTAAVDGDGYQLRHLPRPEWQAVVWKALHGRQLQEGVSKAAEGREVGRRGAAPADCSCS
jgi:hypothetical protein